MKRPRRTDRPGVTARLIEHGWSVMDGIYTLIARNRYRLFGRRAICLLAEPGMLRRFVQ